MFLSEAELEHAFIESVSGLGYKISNGSDLHRTRRDPVIVEDLFAYLEATYKVDGITDSEMQSVAAMLQRESGLDLYSVNRELHNLLVEGFYLRREDESLPPLFIRVIDVRRAEDHIFRAVNQLEFQGSELRIPDVLIFINGIPLVHIELKSPTVESATLDDAHRQITNRYARDIPELMKFNSLCVISDGGRAKVGTLFSPYNHFYGWKDKRENIQSGLGPLFDMAQSLFERGTLLDVISNFVFFPDTSQKREKVMCRYPQYFATNSLFDSVIDAMRPTGNGKGGTYFSSTGSGKSMTMLFLVRKLMRDPNLRNPSFLIITDRTDLDDQLSELFTNSKKFIGEDTIVSIDSKVDLKDKLQGLESGGVFLTTIQKFTSETLTLSERSNIICISDEAHRSQHNIERKISFEENAANESFGFAKYLHDSLPNATYVGVTGTPIDETLAIFGSVADAYTMSESVEDGITVPIIYEGRSAKVTLDSDLLEKIEEFYLAAESAGSGQEEVNKSKSAMARLDSILGDSDRLNIVAADFVEHYERRITEGASEIGKAMFVCSSRAIAYKFWQVLTTLRPEWFEVQERENTDSGSSSPIERVRMVMTRDKDDPSELYSLLGDKDSRKELDRQFKDKSSNFRIAIVVDMWLTGFDVETLDVIYIDKPIHNHSLIQTISRVNRIFPGKTAGLVVDYVGIRKNLSEALAKFSNPGDSDIDLIDKAVTITIDTLELLERNSTPHQVGDFHALTPLEKMAALSEVVELFQQTVDREQRMKKLLDTLSRSYRIASASDELSSATRDACHFFLAVRTLLAKTNKTEAPDAETLNLHVRELVSLAIQGQGIELVSEAGLSQENIFTARYFNQLASLKPSHTKVKLLNQLLSKTIAEYGKVNRIKALYFSAKLASLVEEYNNRRAVELVQSEVLDTIADRFASLFEELKVDRESFRGLGIDFEEKAFFDILVSVASKYSFTFPEDKVIKLATEIKKIVADKSVYTDWARKTDIRAELKVDLILLLDKCGYPPVPTDEVFRDIFEQAESFRRFVS